MNWVCGYKLILIHSWVIDPTNMNHFLQKGQKSHFQLSKCNEDVTSEISFFIFVYHVKLEFIILLQSSCKSLTPLPPPLKKI